MPPWGTTKVPVPIAAGYRPWVAEQTAPEQNTATPGVVLRR